MSGGSDGGDVRRPIYRTVVAPFANLSPLRQGLVAAMLVTLAVILLLPGDMVPSIRIHEEYEHAILFFAYAAILALIVPHSFAIALMIWIPIIVLGEVVQVFAPGRALSWIDLWSGTLGVVTGHLFASAIFRIWLRISRLVRPHSSQEQDTP